MIYKWNKWLNQAEDKENSGYRGNPEETPLVTKMVRRFELPAGGKTKPEVPKKPTRLSNQWKAEAEASVHRCDSGSDTGSGSRKGVTRADSVNDHGYFTLEKRKHPEIRKADESPSLPHAADEMDLRHNFEEFHLDSLEEEEHFYELGNLHNASRKRTGTEIVERLIAQVKRAEKCCTRMRPCWWKLRRCLWRNRRSALLEHRTVPAATELNGPNRTIHRPLRRPPRSFQLATARRWACQDPCCSRSWATPLRRPSSSTGSWTSADWRKNPS